MGRDCRSFASSQETQNQSPQTRTLDRYQAHHRAQALGLATSIGTPCTSPKCTYLNCILTEHHAGSFSFGDLCYGFVSASPSVQIEMIDRKIALGARFLARRKELNVSRYVTDEQRRAKRPEGEKPSEGRWGKQPMNNEEDWQSPSVQRARRPVSAFYIHESRTSVRLRGIEMCWRRELVL